MAKVTKQTVPEGVKTVQEMNPGREPGVYIGLSMEEYHNDTAIGSSGIKTLIKDGGARRYWEDSPLNPHRKKLEATASMRFGTIYHTLVLEPERFDYEVKPKVQSTKEEGKVGEGDYNDMMAMKQELLCVPEYVTALSGGLPEVSIFWRDHETGIMCKVRYDYFAPEWIIDLKTTDSIDSHDQFYSFGRYGYDVSGAMYSVAAAVLKDMLRAGYELPPEFPAGFAEKFLSHNNQIFGFLFQEKDSPFIAQLQVLAPDVAAVGRDKFRKGLSVYQDHQYNTERWPTGLDVIKTVGLENVSSSIQY